MTGEDVYILAKENGLKPSLSKWMSGEDVAAFLGIKHRTLRDHMRDGNAPIYFKHNGLTRFTCQAVADYVNKLESGALRRRPAK